MALMAVPGDVIVRVRSRSPATNTGCLSGTPESQQSTGVAVPVDSVSEMVQVPWATLPPATGLIWQ
jgi:hypothetical protein